MLSVVVVTYNDPARLRLALHGLRRQTLAGFELWVVHDGGDRKINRPVYEELRGHWPGLKEIWLGPETARFRLAAARNAGLKRARGERVLFLDGDCIPAPDVAAAHAAYGDSPVLVCGARKHLPESCLSWLGPEHLGALDRHVTRGDDRYRMKGPIHRPLYEKLGQGLTTIPLTHPYQAWGFQYSAPTAMARAIGGFNEAFVAWGGEDQEFAGRLAQAGVAPLGRFDLMCYHLDHPARRQNTDWVRLIRESLRQPDPVRNGGPLPGPGTRNAGRAKGKRRCVRVAPKAQATQPSRHQLAATGSLR